MVADQMLEAIRQLDEEHGRCADVCENVHPDDEEVLKCPCGAAQAATRRHWSTACALTWQQTVKDPMEPMPAHWDHLAPVEEGLAVRMVPNRPVATARTAGFAEEDGTLVYEVY